VVAHLDLRPGERQRPEKLANQRLGGARADEAPGHPAVVGRDKAGDSHAWLSPPDTAGSAPAAPHMPPGCKPGA